MLIYINYFITYVLFSTKLYILLSILHITAVVIIITIIFFIRGSIPRYKIDLFIKLTWHWLVYIILLWVLFLITINII